MHGTLWVISPIIVQVYFVDKWKFGAAWELEWAKPLFEPLEAAIID